MVAGTGVSGESEAGGPTNADDGYIEAVYAKPKLSQPGDGHKTYPYLLKGLKIAKNT
jgi:hypothetical protein